MCWFNIFDDRGDLIFFFQAEDGIRDGRVTGVQTCALPISEEDVVQQEERVERAHVLKAGIAEKDRDEADAVERERSPFTGLVDDSSDSRRGQDRKSVV